MQPTRSDGTKALIDRYKKANSAAESCLDNDEYQQAMALYYDASQSADEMCERFLKLLVKTSPSSSHRVLLVEFLGWRLRYYTTQYDYHLAVAQTLTGLPREEWIARLETILVLSQSLVTKLLPILKDVEDSTVSLMIHEVLVNWLSGVRKLITNLKSWSMASAQASRVLEWALDNGIDNGMNTTK